jgi:hypothetical protein
MIAKKPIRQENISAGALNTQLQAGVIQNSKIVNNTISRGKFALGSFTEAVLGNMADTLKAGLFKEALPKNLFNRNLFLAGVKDSFKFNQATAKFSADLYPETTIEDNFTLPDSSYWRYVKPRTLSSNHVADNIILGQYLSRTYGTISARNALGTAGNLFTIFRHGPGSIIEDGAIRPEHLSNELKTLLGITL